MEQSYLMKKMLTLKKLIKTNINELKESQKIEIKTDFYDKGVPPKKLYI